MSFFGGIEGGASNTTALILNEAGTIVARQQGSGSNGWLIGIPKVADLLIDLFHKAKAEAGIPVSSPLASIGMCMSGFLQVGPQEELKAALREKDPRLSDNYYVGNDSPGSIYTAAGDAGGLVIISGTGTMAQVIDGTGEAHNCGGWGHMFGDEGSAYYVASTAIRRIFRALDGYTTDPVALPVPDVSRAYTLMLQHFEVADKDGMLDVFYKTFEKGRVAGFTKVLAAAAVDGDAFSRSVFARAGTHLGSMARTLAPFLLRPAPAPQTEAPVVIAPPVVTIVCVGSMWKSWPLLRDAFVAAATAGGSAGAERRQLSAFELVRLTESSAVGAAWKGSQLCSLSGGRSAAPMRLRCAEYVEVLYTHHAAPAATV